MEWAEIATQNKQGEQNESMYFIKPVIGRNFRGYDMNKLEQDYLEHGRFMTPRQRNQSIESVHLEQALRQIKRIESERTLLNGHFSKVAKQYGVKVKDLKKEYAK